ncbi:Helitron helicase-like protein [Phytophthora palmivora]|uniref:Helitron helicase-like protein n=1 Tax=Phytophthora palmivora TaxID=4796 RepID=A0A2P4XGL8_9STRA|nr:Helitron helicase-like protein [Phytophthora palmivora]
MSLREFVAYLLYDHPGSHSRLLLGGRLASTGQERLRYIENNQLEFRIETILGLSDVYRREDTEVHRVAAVHDHYARNYTSNRGYRQNTSEEEIGIDTNNIGGRLIFTDGPRYMYQRFRDAMAIVRELFITLTCNPKWVEIQENIRHGQTSSDRPDRFSWQN